MRDIHSMGHYLVTKRKEVQVHNPDGWAGKHDTKKSDTRDNMWYDAIYTKGLE